jgi:hypothetical protein
VSGIALTLFKFHTLSGMATMSFLRLGEGQASSTLLVFGIALIAASATRCIHRLGRPCIKEGCVPERISKASVWVPVTELQESQKVSWWRAITWLMKY